LRPYARRWEIELFFRDAKAYLGLDDYRVTGEWAPSNIAMLVVLTYELLHWQGTTCDPPSSTLTRSRALGDEIDADNVAASSEFASTCLLSEVERFALRREVGMGDSLAIAATVLAREPERLRVECRADCADSAVAEGVLSVEVLPLAACAPPQETRSLWRELSAPPLRRPRL